MSLHYWGAQMLARAGSRNKRKKWLRWEMLGGKSHALLKAGFSNLTSADVS